ncbi:uncharacterized protein [Ptychodera flava]|uniref:uncharacterized protein n=1 Tax=Ptychodera flava TaxID=63121 RepID=UPI003969C30F
MGCSPSSARQVNAAELKHEPLEGETAGDVEGRNQEGEVDDGPPDYSLIEKDLTSIDNVLEFLSNEVNLTADESKSEILNRLMQLHELYDLSESAEKHEQFANYLVQGDYPTLYIKMHKQWHSTMHENQAGQMSFWGYVGALEIATMVLGNTCDSSPKMCRTVGKAGLVKILIEELEQMKGYASQSERDERKESYLEAVLSTLHNAIRLCNDNRGYFRDAGAVSLFQFYLELDNLLYRALALLTLSYIIDDEENDKINAGNENIEFLVALLKSAVAAEDHREQEHGFHVTELVDGMTKLAFNDVNKVTFVEVGVLPLLVQLLQDGNSLEEQRLSATALWTLAFHKDNKDKIRKAKGCVKALERLKGEEDAGLKKACAGALWELKEQEVGQQTGGSTGHVMISYNWDVQKRMIKLKTKLQAAGYDVWMDIEKMGGSTLAAMAEAVQGADVVLICMSEKYKFSNPCRSEAEYTYKLQKSYIPIRVERNYSPDGWLGILVGTKLYFDFASDELLGRNFQNLVREIGDRGKIKDVVVKKSEVGVAQSAKDAPHLGESHPGKDNVESWGYAEITTWLDRNGAGHLAPKLKKYTGRQLLTLKEICSEAPEFFYSSLKKDVGFRDLYDIALFKEALADIK